MLLIILTIYPNQYKFSPTIKTTVSLPYDASTYPLLGAYAAGTQGFITLRTADLDDTESGHLAIVSVGRIDANPMGTDGNYESIELSISNEVGTPQGYSLQIVLNDSNDRNYPAIIS